MDRLCASTSKHQPLPCIPALGLSTLPASTSHSQLSQCPYAESL